MLPTPAVSREIFMIWLESALKAASGFVSGPVTIVLMLGVGACLTIGLRAMPWRKIPRALRELWIGKRPEGDGDITPFQTLMTGLSATIDTGNIAGVATAIVPGGPVIFRVTQDYFGKAGARA